ncbi:hypothetical protein [Dyella acidiphila]|uniref:Uncharacterized protein n=1 Tax=Dyella acidiphila TaxID=2775866 RepID=A0ABR9GCG0_9GAMM|nr:hypothetical protein [Dyella acidiphila]MBE1161729.1 hypothetical protein [Dyella acidiphila]
MSDTIELLETIGRDASLRHAPLEELADKLRQAQASETLIAAVETADSSVLTVELGHEKLDPPQGTLGPCHEEDEPDQDDEPHHHPRPTPDQDKSSPKH